VYDTVQVRDVPLPPSVHVEAPNEPEPDVVQLTDPVGPVAPAPATSETVTVQAVAVPTPTEAGAQPTVVDVPRAVATIVAAADPPLWVDEPA
jgi:hypothetical protein